MKHYTYIITNKINNKSYIGVRSCKGIPKEDIGHKYFSSSSDSEFINEQREYPEIFIYKVLNIFDKREDALSEEIRLHKLYNVDTNPNFYNLAKQSSSGIDFTGKNHTESTKLKIGEASKKRGISEKAKNNLKWHRENRCRTEEERLKMANSKLGNTNAKGKRSEIAKNNISNGRKGQIPWNKGKSGLCSEETKNKMSSAKLGDNNPKYWKGKKRSIETIQKISQSKKGKSTGPAPIVKCPHCDKEGGLYAMKQWHFNNCRHNK